MTEIIERKDVETISAIRNLLYPCVVRQPWHESQAIRRPGKTDAGTMDPWLPLLLKHTDKYKIYQKGNRAAVSIECRKTKTKVIYSGQLQQTQTV